MAEQTPIPIGQRIDWQNLSAFAQQPQQPAWPPPRLPRLAGPMPQPQAAPQPSMGPRQRGVDELLFGKLVELGIPEHTAAQIASMGGFIGGGAFEGGRAMAEGVAEGSPGQVALGAAMALPGARLPAGLRPLMQTGGAPMGAGMTRLARGAAQGANRRLPGAPPPGGSLPYAAAGAAAGGAGGYELSEGDPLAALGGMVGGGILGTGIARGVGSRMRFGPPTGRARTPDTGTSIEGRREVRRLPATGRPPAGGGLMATRAEQEAAVTEYLRAGHQPPGGDEGPWGATQAQRDAFVRDAVRWFRQRR